MSNLRAVIFDLDGVILDSERVYRSCWQRAAAELDREVSDELYLRLIGCRDQDAEKTLIRELGKDFPLEEFRQRWWQYFGEFLERDGLPRKAGVENLLDFLEQHDLATAIATSTERKRAAHSLGSLAQRFRVMISGDQIERGKPAPDIFLLAAERLNVLPEHCWVIEDSEPGIRAASAAGMTAVLVPDLTIPTDEVRELATHVCGSLDEVREILREKLEARNRS